MGIGQMRTPAGRGGRVKDLADVRKLVLFNYSNMFCGHSLWVMPIL